MHNYSPTNLEYKPCGLMAENVSKMIRQKIIAVYYDIKC